MNEGDRRNLWLTRRGIIGAGGWPNSRATAEERYGPTA
jgi:hypothetical protein